MRRPERLLGPETARPEDIERINRVFSDAFTDRYQRDGLSGVRVPPLNPAIWRFAMAVAGDGALLWRDPSKQLVAFNLVHRSGAEGWMGPLAVRPDRQGEGIGRLIVEEGIRRLTAAGARIIGLETMPRTIENIGFYSGLGFRPGHLTVSMTRDLAGSGTSPASRLSAGPAGPALRACRALTDAAMPGVDFTREMELTLEQGLGDATLLSESGRLAGFALWHTAPLAEGRSPDEARVLKLVARDLPAFRRLVSAIESDAWTAGARRVSIRCQTADRDAYGVLLDAGYRVHWTDLRMTLQLPDAPPADAGVKRRAIVFSNWEI
ncbi:MAG TPA: GNAT family N-acetyltransferase [Gemmatimonadales bacterium]